ncbi:IclR family transcriptional regulator [Ruegeria hyattellae]|uniref:IclR family transcriptional regulator n=1 Tax=Ruegeria hyattellae TaxID=3233337 RepID=UPI00355B1EDD
MQDSDKRYANTLARGLCILRAFRPTDNGLGNLDLSERTGIPRSTVSRLTFTLCALGYLTHGRHHDKYRLGPAALALGNIAAASFSFVEIATPIMQRLADETATLIGVAIQDDGKMLMVKTWRPAGSPSIWLDVGYRMPMLSSSSGAAYVGALTNEETAKLATLLPEDQGEALARLTEQAREQLLAHGYAFVSGSERFARSINALATPYRPSEFGAPVSFFSGATSDALSDDRIHDRVGPALARAVDELRRATGQTLPVIAPI